MLEKNK